MSSVTHELRTPLSAIRAFSEILYDDPEIELAERKRFLGIWSARPNACRAW
jgi:signal transduction histidine kinase